VSASTIPRERLRRSIERQLPAYYLPRDLLALVAAEVEESDPDLAAALRRLVAAADRAGLSEHAEVSVEPVPGTWGAFLAFMREHEPLLDADFAHDVAAARTALDSPTVPADPWAC
jgi:hypothetical protein